MPTPPSASNQRGVPLTLSMCGHAWVGVGNLWVPPSQSPHLKHPLQAGWEALASMQEWAGQ